MKNFLENLLKDKNITDISYNGKDFFVQHNKKGRYKIESNITKEEVEKYIKQLTYQSNKQFNDEQPILDTEFPNLRINAVHDTCSPYGLTVSWRSSIPTLKVNNYDKEIAPKIIFSLIEACIKSECNVLISGKTGTGKTEMQKYLVGFIPDNDKICLIEDTLDTHLKDLYPNKDILSWQTNEKIENNITFDDLIKAGLRNNPDWIIISETRGSEAYSMLKSCLSGHNIITTLHSNSAKNNIDRLVHMCKEKFNLEQKLLGSMICENFDIGIHLDRNITENGVIRYIAEVVEYIGYGDKGTIVNSLFSRNIEIVKKNGRYSYNIEYNYGKISKKLFNKLVNKKCLNIEIEKFTKEEYFSEKNVEKIYTKY